MVHSFINGCLLALGAIMAIGPQNAFILSSANKDYPFLKFLPTIVTAALCDTFLILLASYSVSASLFKIKYIRVSMVLLGCLFIAYMGYKLWFNSSGHLKKQPKKLLAAKQQILFTLSVSLLNPQAILDTFLIIGTNSLNYVLHEKRAFLTGCILISWLWFFSLAKIAHYLSKVQSFSRLQDKISAVIMWICAVIMVYNING